MNRDHPLPGILETPHQGDDRAGFEIRSVDLLVDPLRLVILFIAGERGDFGRIVFDPLGIPPLIHVGLDPEKFFAGFGLVHANQSLVDIGDSRLSDHFAQNLRVVEKVALEILDPLELKLVDDTLDCAIVLFLHAQRHLREQ